jgi:Domain of unknown function (DUF6265)
LNAVPLATFILTLALGQVAPRPTVDRVMWLQGCWAMDSNGRLVEEQWLAPRASSMLGVGRTTRGTTLVDYEMVLIRERGDQLAYEAHPANQQPALFMSTSIGERSIVFENLKHDFPQRVGYERRGDRLAAWIEGPQNGQTRRVDFVYERVPCAGD